MEENSEQKGYINVIDTHGEIKLIDKSEEDLYEVDTALEFSEKCYEQMWDNVIVPYLEIPNSERILNKLDPAIHKNIFIEFMKNNSGYKMILNDKLDIERNLVDTYPALNNLLDDTLKDDDYSTL
jgi:hypothetical protein